MMIIWEPIHGDVDSAVLALFVAAKLLVPGVIEFSRVMYHEWPGPSTIRWHQK